MLILLNVLHAFLGKYGTLEEIISKQCIKTQDQNKNQDEQNFDNKLNLNKLNNSKQISNKQISNKQNLNMQNLNKQNLNKQNLNTVKEGMPYTGLQSLNSDEPQLPGATIKEKKAEGDGNRGSGKDDMSKDEEGSVFYKQPLTKQSCKKKPRNRKNPVGSDGSMGGASGRSNDEYISDDQDTDMLMDDPNEQNEYSNMFDVDDYIDNDDFEPMQEKGLKNEMSKERKMQAGKRKRKPKNLKRQSIGGTEPEDTFQTGGASNKPNKKLRLRKVMSNQKNDRGIAGEIESGYDNIDNQGEGMVVEQQVPPQNEDTMNGLELDDSDTFQDGDNEQNSLSSNSPKMQVEKSVVTNRGIVDDVKEYPKPRQSANNQKDKKRNKNNFKFKPRIKKIVVPGKPREVCIVKVIPIPVDKNGHPIRRARKSKMKL